MSRRAVLALAAVVATAAVVVAGVVLSGGVESAQPVARDPGGGTDPAASSDTEAGEAPLEIAGTDPVTGETVSLEQFAGQPVVLNFWASWCPPCREELPALIELAEARPEAAVVGVNFQDDPGGARDLQREIGFDFPSIADPQGEIGASLGIQGMPTTYFLDAEHRVVALIAGGTDLAGFERGLRLASEGRG